MSPKRIYLLAYLALLGLACAPTRAHAEDDPPGYQEFVSDAIREFDAGNYEEARSLFRRAHELYPNARTHRGLGYTEFELRNYGACIRELNGALASRVKPLDDRLLQDTKRVLSRARGFVAQLSLEVTPEPSQVFVDGVPIRWPTEQSIVLRVGEHTLELHAPGFAPEKRHLSFSGGEQQALHIVFSRPTHQVETDPQRARQMSTDQRHWAKRPWLWTAVGVVVVGAAAGTAVALTRAPGVARFDSP